MSTISRMLKPHAGGLEEVYEYDGYMGVNDSGIIADDILGVVGTKTGTGEYTLTFAPDSKPGVVRSISILPVAATNVDRVIKLKSVSNTAIVFQTMVGSSPTDPAVPCGFYIQITGRKTGVSR